MDDPAATATNPPIRHDPNNFGVLEAAHGDAIDPTGTTGADVSGAWATIEELVDVAVRAGRSANTIRAAYRGDLIDFVAFCSSHTRSPMPATPDTVAGYVAWLAVDVDDRPALKPSTIARRLSAISTAHHSFGHPSPTLDPKVKMTMRGIRRGQGVAPQSKRAVSTAELVHVLAGLDDTPRARRDAALLLIGFAAARRRSELAALCVGDIENRPEGIAITVRRSKTDQESSGHTVGIVYGAHELTCPVLALRAWLDVLDRHQPLRPDAPLWRPIRGHATIGAAALSDRSIFEIVRRRLAGTGIAASEWGAHSLRRGHATEAARNGATDRQIMRTGAWRSQQTLARYIDDGTLFEQPSSGHLGL